ncbi:MAG TPA: hypothetical protein VJ251_15995 [Stellaceae bacterium]|nr:hypothetical protein [Stellaceae bacterium]
MELPARPAGPIDRAIADPVARLIPDDATIELGLGAIPQAVTNALGRKQGLGVHSGAIGDGIADGQRPEGQSSAFVDRRRIGRSAPIPDLPAFAPDWGGSTLSCRSR